MEIIYNEYSDNGHEVLNLWIIKNGAFFSETGERPSHTEIPSSVLACKWDAEN